jgi:hypothetical protein
METERPGLHIARSPEENTDENVTPIPSATNEQKTQDRKEIMRFGQKLSNSWREFLSTLDPADAAIVLRGIESFNTTDALDQSVKDDGEVEKAYDALFGQPSESQEATIPDVPKPPAEILLFRPRKSNQ